ncbi:hypothetical protein CVU82_01985 [Candidatus Falkowbacteria bacterium HGW-Falkowbacteria-1]|uniref:O-antigen ligase-related domain-containing protein n=1 Tax=Candidatus Falkowbacteria bacterium HGW-Falkowbacteria-1 TaxID=2013768 RepID=A0A2N2E9F6_9BACT|nr:MAG: hypothetical protein CVU82_01985 [Candidatus Falkowbacteria bacterium HGW-Falkowbacteria-1]
MLNFDFLTKNKKIIFFIFLASLFLEMLSFVSFNFPVLNTVIFFAIVVVFILLSLYKLKLGLYFVLAEVFLNSMGYLFYYEYGGLKISLRISLWLILMSIFLAKIILKTLKDKKIIGKVYKDLIFKNNFLYLAVFIVLAFFLGLFRNSFGDVFFDFNAWLYFTLILPFGFVIHFQDQKEKKLFWQDIALLFMGIALYVCFKSLLFLFLFSHDLRPIISDLYSWTRVYALGEITNMNNGVYRIFFQNQIFNLLALFFSLSALLSSKKIKEKSYLIILSSFFISTVVISFSRSFWFGLVSSLIFLLFISVYKFKLKKTVNYFGQIFLTLILSLSIIFIVIKFPWPNINNEFGMDSISDRANITSNESAISSRWALLDVIKDDLRANFLFGRGFGARLEYFSSDPRVLESSPDGKYSTYTFEWGWLDILLKMGIFGFLAYFVLIFLILKKSLFYFFDKQNFNFLAIFLGIISISAVNFFTPYLNHPLGISYIIILVLFLNFCHSTKEIC